MNFGSLIGLANRNKSDSTSVNTKCYSTAVSPALKPVRSSGPSPNVRAFLAKQDREKKEKDATAKKEKDHLLSLRAQNAKNNKKAKIMASRTKDNDFSKIRLMTDEQLEAKKKREMELQRKMLTDKTERMKARIQLEERDAQLPHKRKRKKRPEVPHEDLPPRVEPVQQERISDDAWKTSNSGNSGPPVKKKKMAPTPQLSFQELLKVAAEKQNQSDSEASESEVEEEDPNRRPMSKKDLEHYRELEMRRKGLSVNNLPKRKKPPRPKKNQVPDRQEEDRNSPPNNEYPRLNGNVKSVRQVENNRSGQYTPQGRMLNERTSSGPREQQTMSNQRPSNQHREQQSVSRERTANVSREQQTMSRERTSSVPRGQQTMSRERTANVPREQQAISRERTSSVPREQKTMSRERTSSVPHEQQTMPRERTSSVPRGQHTMSRERTSSVPRGQPTMSRERTSSVPREQQIMSRERTSSVPREQQTMSRERTSSVHRDQQMSKGVRTENYRTHDGANTGSVNGRYPEQQSRGEERRTSNSQVSRGGEPREPVGRVPSKSPFKRPENPLKPQHSSSDKLRKALQGRPVQDSQSSDRRFPQEGRSPNYAERVSLEDQYSEGQQEQRIKKPMNRHPNSKSSYQENVRREQISNRPNPRDSVSEQYPRRQDPKGYPVVKQEKSDIRRENPFKNRAPVNPKQQVYPENAKTNSRKQAHPTRDVSRQEPPKPGVRNPNQTPQQPQSARNPFSKPNTQQSKAPAPRSAYQDPPLRGQQKPSNLPRDSQAKGPQRPSTQPRSAHRDSPVKGPQRPAVPKQPPADARREPPRSFKEPPPVDRPKLPPIGHIRHKILGPRNPYGKLPSKISSQYYESEEEDDDDDMKDFIDDGTNEDCNEDYSRYIRDIFGYDRRRYAFDDDDDEVMESSFAEQMKEEQRSARIGLLEDLEDIRKEEEEKKMMKKRKK